MNEHLMRRKDRALTEAQALETLQSALFATVSCLMPDGTPYGVTVSHAVEGKTLYFHCAMQGLKVDCFTAHDRVCVSAVAHAETDAPGLTTKYRSAVCFGRIRALSGQEAANGLRVIGRKFSPEHMPAVEDCIGKSMDHTRVYAVELNEVHGKGNI